MKIELKFMELNDNVVKILRVELTKEVLIGKLQNVRAGKYMSWRLFLFKDQCLSAPNLDQVREKIRELNALNKGLNAYG